MDFEGDSVYTDMGRAKSADLSRTLTFKMVLVGWSGIRELRCILALPKERRNPDG